MVLAHVHTANPVHDPGAMVHVVLALAIMTAYLIVPFTALRRLPLPWHTRLAAFGFFLTCALTHLAIAVGFHENRLMLANDTVQLVCVVAFITTLSRLVGETLRRRDARRPADQEAPR